MRKFIQNKLWRDKSVAKLQQDGSRLHWRYLSDEEFNEQIRVKLLEEAHEAVTAKNRKDLLSELADLYEVIDSLAAVNDISRDEIIRVQMEKHEERGGFSGRHFVQIAEHPAGGYAEQYCLADPEKYPEVI